MKNILMAVVVLTAGWAAFTLLPAQEPAPAGAKFKTAVKGYPGGNYGTLFVGAAPVTGAPYSALAVTETTQTLGDGNRIAQSQSQRVFRDSQGRERTEDASTSPGSTAGVRISDPVAKTAYRLDSQTHTAVPSPAISLSLASPRTTIFVDGAQMVLNNGIMRAQGDSAKTETLPLQNIEGVFATGTRSTVTIPAGEIGNQLPISLVDEAWYSADLHVNVMTKHSDPRSGEVTYRLTQISRAEPDPQLFQVPADYTIMSAPAGGRGRGGGRSGPAPATGGRSGGPAPDAVMVTVPGTPVVSGAVMTTKVVSRVDPQYTEEARKAKWQGTVVVKLTVDEAGVPHDLAVVKPLGMGLDQKAIDAVSQWRFQPATLNGAPTKVEAQVEVQFKLQ